MDWMAFWSFVVVTTFTPGPNNLMAMAGAGMFGYRRTVGFTLGVALGFVIIMAISAWMNIILSDLIPTFHSILAILGSVYMLHLMAGVLRRNGSRNQDSETAPKRFTLWMGLILQFINPKVILYGITAMGSFVIPNFRSPASLVLFSILLALMGLISTTGWALCGSAMQRGLARHEKAFGYVMAVLLAYSSWSLLSGLWH